MATSLATLAVALGPTTAAAAQPYPVIGPELSVDSATITAGTSVVLQGVGYLPSEDVRIGLMFTRGAVSGSAARVGPDASEVEVVTADASGAFTTDVPVDQAGTALISATGETSDRTTSTTVLVLPEGTVVETGGPGGPGGPGAGAGGGGGGLPVTGSDGGLLVRQALLGGVTLLAGVFLVWLSMRRRRRATAGD
ncbi:hypothetical protein GCM10009681_51080 [Luedemannella helvata]|uniref:LPXTG cell wall anchor domain-containing protein n=1 Tax=Luedemannella helvata TaxID=349315 RepID=A0ABP4XCQ8_9ACTN